MKKFKSQILVFISTTVIILVYLNIIDEDLSPKTERNLDSNFILEELNTENLQMIKPSACVYTIPMYNDVKSLICLKRGDQYVSQFIEVDGGWEIPIVTKVMEAMDHYPNAVFIDAGSNIGAFTIPVATMRRKVLAVDMMSDNLAYIRKSLQMANLTQYVQLIHNALSDKYETYYPAYPSKYKDNGTIRNPGAKKAVSLDNKNATSTVDIVGPPVNSITLGDVTRKASNTSLHLFHHTPTFIIKSDIQDFDCQVLNMDDDFFKTNFIPYIFVEWNTHQEACSNLFFKLKNFGYTPWTIKEDSITDITENCLFAKCIKYRDLLWIHEDSKKLWKTIENKCNCKCITEESKNLEVRSCPLNETLVIEQRIELHGGVEY